MLIRDTAARLAHHIWVERRLFEVVGAWTVDADDGEVAGVLGAVSHHHAWRASQLEPLVPVLHDLGPAELAPSPAWVAYLDCVVEASATLDRVAGLSAVVLPDLLFRYEADLAGTGVVADAPVARVLTIVRDDLRRDWWAATSLLRSFPRTEEDLERVTAHQVALERRLLHATTG